MTFFKTLTVRRQAKQSSRRLTRRSAFRSDHFSSDGDAFLFFLGCLGGSLTALILALIIQSTVVAFVGLGLLTIALLVFIINTLVE